MWPGVSVRQNVTKCPMRGPRPSFTDAWDGKTLQPTAARDYCDGCETMSFECGVSEIGDSKDDTVGEMCERGDSKDVEYADNVFVIHGSDESFTGLRRARLSGQWDSH